MGREQRSIIGADGERAGGPREGLQRPELEQMGQLSLQGVISASLYFTFSSKKSIYGQVWDCLAQARH